MPEEAKETLVIIGVIAVFSFLAYVAGGNNGKQDMRVEAVKHGAAHWVVADDGTTKFEWNNEEATHEQGE